MHGDPVTVKLMATSDSSEWERVARLDLDFATDHPQGLIRVGDRWFLSTVRIPEGEPGNPDLTVPGDSYLIEDVHRWGVPPGGSLPLSAEAGAMLRYVEEGTITATKVTEEVAMSSDEEPFTVDYSAGSAIYPLALDAGQMVAFSNDGEEPAKVYELKVEPASG